MPPSRPIRSNLELQLGAWPRCRTENHQDRNLNAYRGNAAPIASHACIYLPTESHRNAWTILPLGDRRNRAPNLRVGTDVKETAQPEEAGGRRSRRSSSEETDADLLLGFSLTDFGSTKLGAMIGSPGSETIENPERVARERSLERIALVSARRADADARHFSRRKSLKPTSRPRSRG